MWKFILLMLIAFDANALTCSIKGADGKTYYVQTTLTKTLGTVATIKPCPKPVLMVPYDNNYGMKLLLNMNGCFYLKVENRALIPYEASYILNGKEVCP